VDVLDEGVAPVHRSADVPERLLGVLDKLLAPRSRSVGVLDEGLAPGSRSVDVPEKLLGALREWLAP
jgi:hypothetical protein